MPDAINPSYYKDGWSNGAELIDITENLNCNGAQAVQYIARSTRLDGKNKGNPAEDLRKAGWFINREITRLDEIEKPRGDTPESENLAEYVWTSLLDVPADTRVLNRFGSRFECRSGVWWFVQPGGEGPWEELYSPGAWEGPFKRDSEPRVWDSLADVPHDVVVVDCDGDRWDYRHGHWGFIDKYDSNAFWHKTDNPSDWVGPFTEVIS